MLFQAGSSPAGRAFAARHAEGQFIQAPSPQVAAKLVTDTRALVERSGRLPQDLKFFQGMSVVVGSTDSEAGHSAANWLREHVTDRTPTIRDAVIMRSRATRLVGTPEQIADRLAEWHDAGVDGVLLYNAVLPGSYDEFIAHVLPTLRERGLAREEYEPGTLRRKWFGHDRLPDRHPAARYRGAYAAASL